MNKKQHSPQEKVETHSGTTDGQKLSYTSSCNPYGKPADTIEQTRKELSIEDAERILINFHSWYIWEYQDMKNKRQKTISDVVKYYLRKNKENWNDE